MILNITYVCAQPFSFFYPPPLHTHTHPILLTAAGGEPSAVGVVANGEALSGAAAAVVAVATVSPYTTVPAFARDMNLVFANVRRVWPMGSVGGDNRLTKAADALKMAFDTRWRALAPRLHSIQVWVEACVWMLSSLQQMTFLLEKIEKIENNKQWNV